MKAIEKEKGIELEILFEALEVALVSAYKRNFQAPGNVRVSVDRENGTIKVFSQLEVVEEVELPHQEVELYEARVYDSRCQVGDQIEMEVTPQEFGRIAAQTAKQVIIDVYKRQVSGSDPGWPVYRHSRYWSSIESLPVSYTHLDVYKRQAWTWLTGPWRPGEQRPPASMRPTRWRWNSF